MQFSHNIALLTACRTCSWIDMHNLTLTLAADLLFVDQLRNEVKLRSKTMYILVSMARAGWELA